MLFECLLHTSLSERRTLKKAYVGSREGNCGLDPRGSPSPNFGDGLGTGIDLIKVSGTVRGRGHLQFRGFLGRNPQKTLNFGAGTGATFSGISGTLRGRGQSKLSGIFKGFSGNLYFLVKS